jgi:F-type H+-transporting ATPase subunit delta
MAETRGTSAIADTGQQRLGKTYAEALLGATEKAGNTETVLAEFDSLVNDVLEKLPQLDATLSSPRVGRAEKEQMLDRAFAGKMSVELLRFLKVVAKHGRLDCLRFMLESAHELYNELRGRVAVEVRSAGPLGSELQQLLDARLRQALAGRRSLPHHLGWCRAMHRLDGPKTHRDSRHDRP